MNAHYLYALARAGRRDAVEAGLASVRARSDDDDEEARRVWGPVGRPVVEAAAAFGAGDRARAAQLLDPVMPLMTSIGGSDAQDDLFRQTYLRSLQAARAARRCHGVCRAHHRRQSAHAARPRAGGMSAAAAARVRLMLRSERLEA